MTINSITGIKIVHSKKETSIINLATFFLIRIITGLIISNSSLMRLHLSTMKPIWRFIIST